MNVKKFLKINTKKIVRRVMSRLKKERKAIVRRACEKLLSHTPSPVFPNIKTLSSGEACRVACDILAHFWKNGGKCVGESYLGKVYEVGNYYLFEDGEEEGEYSLLEKSEYEKVKDAYGGDVVEVVAWKGKAASAGGYKEKILSGKYIDVFH